MEQITEQLVWQTLRPRAPESNKGSYGHALLCCGSARYRGAARLAAEGALRIGAGLVTLAATEPVLSAVLPALPECICLPLVAAEDGTAAACNSPALSDAAEKATALLFGCGLAQSSNTAALLRTVLESTHCPLVLDADGLNLLAKQAESSTLFHFGVRPVLLTPHPGEMARLCGTSVSAVLAAPEQSARRIATETGAVTLLKMHRTLVALPDGRIFENTTGNAGLARGGSGDILAGMLTGLVAQGYPAEQAALCGVWLHGAAADACAKARSMQAMLPSDLFPFLASLFQSAGF